MPINHALVAWLLEYAALLLTVRYVGADGRTALCRTRGRNFRMDVLNFAEMILYKLPMKGPPARSRWQYGRPMGRGRISGLQQIFEHFHCLRRDRYHYRPHAATMTRKRTVVQ